MPTVFPHTGETLALRIADGSEFVVRVRNADRARLTLTPAIPAATGEGIEAAFVAGDGTGYRVRGRIVHREMHDTIVEVDGVTPLCGRFLRRFAPDRPLLADIAICDESGTVYRTVQGRVRDVALAGAGIAVDGLRSGDQVLVTLTDLNGVRVVSEVSASVVHVAAGVVGVAFVEPFEAAPAMAALASTTRAA
jgi:hypothetical protein